jgi:hypothetical protein
LDLKAQQSKAKCSKDAVAEQKIYHLAKGSSVLNCDGSDKIYRPGFSGFDPALPEATE